MSNRNGDDPPLVLNKVWVDSLTQRNGVAHGFLPPLEWHENRTRVLSRARTARRTVWARRTRKKSPRRSFPSRP